MDEYYSKLAREKLSQAQANLVDAQNYLAAAIAPSWMMDSVSRILSAVRNRQDEIGRIVSAQIRNKASRDNPTP